MARLFSILTLAAFICCASSAPVFAEETSRGLRRTPIVKAVEKAKGCVVNISTEKLVVQRRYSRFRGPADEVFDRFFDDFFRNRRPRGRVERRKVQVPLGSGCVITEDGLVVTSEHVIRRASNIQLSLHNGDTYSAELVAADPIHDVALIRAKLNGKKLKAINMGSSADLMLGETVIALGNPFGFEDSVTSGIVSALDREITVGRGGKYKGLVQTSALINPGNSGGPLVNVLGELIGINTAVVSGAQGIGFAIPINDVRDHLAPLLISRRVAKGWPGFEGESAKNGKGVRVKTVHPRGPAKAVLKAGDIIQSIDGKSCKDSFDFALTVSERKAGGVLQLGLARKGKLLSAKIVLTAFPKVSPEKRLTLQLGVQGQKLTPELARTLRLWVKQGVLITDVAKGSPAAKAGLKLNDVMIQVDGKAVLTPRQAGLAVEAASGTREVGAVVVRGRYRVSIRLPLTALPPI
jgi:S1-C subfamily serine protease